MINLEPTGEPEPPNLPVQRDSAADPAEEEAVWEDDPSSDESLPDAKPQDDD